MEASSTGQRMMALLDGLWALPLTQAVLGLLLVGLLAWLADGVARRLILRLVKRVAQRSENRLDDALLDRGVFRFIAHMAPAAVVQLGVPLVPAVPEDVAVLVRNVAAAFMVLMGTLAVSRALTAVNDVYQRRDIARSRPIKGYVQLVQIVLFIIAAIVIVSMLIGRSPLLLLSGLGAMTAVLLLVFKDTVLSLVASVQLIANDMLRVGDWIEMPSTGADGDVIDIALHTVTVQNWDKTITRIPTWRLINESFKNWRGMKESGGRRIKRAIHLDVASIHFLDTKEVEHFRRMALLTAYIEGKQHEIEAWNRELGASGEEPANRRRLSNVGTFRAYVLAYLRRHPGIHPDMTLLVRQLAPTPSGLPLEVYCFTRTTVWGEHEALASDLFDHFYAMLPEFGLRAFQPPTGYDLRQGVGLLAGSTSEAEGPGASRRA
jgi:miniconductance mechanosensitive channel